jgi:membrane protein YqaA with SNARE-associated domain
MEALLGPLLTLFVASFMAATLIPLPSEAALFAYLQAHPERTALAVAVATVGNTAGGMTSYLIGRAIPRQKLNARAIELLRRYGPPTVAFAWLPLVGDALSVAAGWLRMWWPAVLGFMAVGRLARYAVVAALSS